MTTTKTPATKIDHENLKALYNVLLNLESISDCEKFFEDLCTPLELRSMADRWQVVKLLDEGIPYRTIYEKTGVSTATVTRVARAISFGKGGYSSMLEKLRKGKT